jgi:hypothetical protein
MPETTTADRTSRRGWLAMPCYPVLLAVVAGWFTAWVGAPGWRWIGTGAAGWTIALWLRAPVVVFAGRFTPRPATIGWVVGASSGPIEELVRLAAIVWLVSGMATTVWFAFGWLATETLYVAVSGAVTLVLLGRDDDDAHQVRELLQAQGTLEAHPGYGVLERLSGAALHLGFTLLVAASPWLVPVTAAVHTGANLAAKALVRQSVRTAEAAVVLLATVTLISGLAMFQSGL